MNFRKTGGNNDYLPGIETIHWTLHQNLQMQYIQQFSAACNLLGQQKFTNKHQLHYTPLTQALETWTRILYKKLIKFMQVLLSTSAV